MSALVALVAGLVLVTLVTDAGMSLAVAAAESQDVSWPALSDLAQSLRWRPCW